MLAPKHWTLMSSQLVSCTRSQSASKCPMKPPMVSQRMNRPDIMLTAKPMLKMLSWGPHGSSPRTRS